MPGEHIHRERLRHRSHLSPWRAGSHPPACHRRSPEALPSRARIPVPLSPSLPRHEDMFPPPTTAPSMHCAARPAPSAPLRSGPVTGRPPAPAAHLGATGAFQHLLSESDHVGAAARHLLGQKPLHRVPKARLGVRRAPRRHLTPPAPRPAYPGSRYGERRGPEGSGRCRARGGRGQCREWRLFPNDSPRTPHHLGHGHPQAAQHSPGLTSTDQG